jgi:transposase
MAYREVTLLEVKEVLLLWLRRRGKRAIARSVGLSRNTVRSYLDVATECGLVADAGEGALTEEKLAEVLVRLKGRPRRSRRASWQTCEAQREFVGKQLDSGLRLTKVRKLLVRRGVDVPYPTLHRFAVSELGFGRSSLTVPVADCDAGEELQVDTAWMGYLEPDERGRRRRFRAWLFTAVRSRHRFVYPCFRETTETAIEACEAAWEFFGGVFRVLMPDNTKTIVQVYDPLEPLINATFREYAQKRGFEIDPTRRRSPQDKGRVERAVRPTRDDCFAGEHLQDLEAAHRRARTWCLQDYGMRRHTRTQRLPLEHFEAEEKSALLPAPSVPYDIPHWGDPTIGRDQHGQVLKALYSVPVEFEGRRLIGRKLRARADRTLVRLYLDTILVKTHPRQPPGGRSTDPADFPAEKIAYANRDGEFLRRQATQHGEAVGRFAGALLEGPQPWTRMRRVYSLLGLCKRYGNERVAQACTVALDADMVDVCRLERMLAQASPGTETEPSPHLAKVVPLARYLRPKDQYALPPATSRSNEKEEP